MYVLTQLIPRAETTDTSIIAVADTKEKLETYFKEEILPKAKESHDEEDYLEYFSNSFSIHEVQYI